MLLQFPDTTSWNRFSRYSTGLHVRKATLGKYGYEFVFAVFIIPSDAPFREVTATPVGGVWGMGYISNDGLS